MNNTNSYIICKDIKYKDFLFRRYVKDAIQPNTMYRSYVNDQGDLYLMLNVDGAEAMIYIDKVGVKISDPRFIAHFEEFSIDYLVNSETLPDIYEEELFEDWMDGKMNPEGDDDGDEFPTDIVENALVGIHAMDEQLFSGISEAIRGVERVMPGILMDNEKEQLLEALKGLIDNYDKTGDLDELLMAQYLMFNIINFAKNKW